MPVEQAYYILSYYAHTARGHAVRTRAKALQVQMGRAGAAVYAYGLAGFEVKPAQPEAPKPEPIALPPADLRVSNLLQALAGIGIDLNNPRINQGIQDLSLNILGLGQPAIAPADRPVFLGVAERAEQLGHPPGQVVKVRSALGKFVKAQGIPSTQELRLCNGTQRAIHVYEVSPELDAAIEAFFS